MQYSKVSVAIQHLPETLCEVSALASHEITLGGCTEKLSDKKQIQEEVLQIQQSMKVFPPSALWRLNCFHWSVVSTSGHPLPGHCSPALKLVYRLVSGNPVGGKSAV